MKRWKLTKALTAAGLAIFLTACGSADEQTRAGMQAIEELRYEEALPLFERALVNGEDPELIYRGQGIAYLGLTRYEEAIESLERALGCAAGAGNLEYDINYYLGAAYAKAGRTEDAIAVYTAIIKLRPQEKDAFFYRGTLELSLSRTEEASADFDRAIAIAPKDYGLYVDIAQNLTEAGITDLAQAYLRRALEADDKSMTDFDKGRLYYYLEDYQSARDCLEKARDKQANADNILFLGKAYEALGDYNYAASVYSGYLLTDAAQPGLQNQLGMCYLSMGNYTEALAAFEAGLAVEGNNDFRQVLSFNEIVAHEYLGEFDRAAALMQTYLQTYPDDETAAREYRFLKTR